MNFFNSIYIAIQHSSVFGYLLFASVFFLESLAFIGLLIPGTVFLMIAGFLVARNIFDPEIIIPLALFSTLLGDLISFYWGTKGKDYFKFENKLLKTSYLEKGEKFFDAHGNKSVFLGRFIGPIRPLTSFIAGLCRMKKIKFYILNFLSAVFWVGIYFVLGYFFGQAFRVIELWSNRLGLFLFGLFIFFILVYLLKIFVIKESKYVFSFLKSIFESIKEALFENEDVKKLIEKYPRIFRFIKKRLNYKIFTGFPLTLLAVVFIYFIFSFLAVLRNVLTSGVIVDIDLRVLNLLEIFRHPLLTRAFLWITVLGKGSLIAIFTVLFSILLLAWKKRYYLISLWVAVVSSAIFELLLKMIIKRPRPEDAVYIEKGFSFPSGHAALSTALYGFLIYFFWRNLKRWKTKINILFFNISLIIIVSLSRLYLGVHYFSDVWAGFLLGASGLILGITIGEWLAFKFEYKKEKISINSKMKIISVAVILLAVGSYFFSARSFKPLLKDEEPRNPIVINSPYDLLNSTSFPRYTETLTGTRQEPLSFVIIADNQEEIINMFEKAHWHLADQIDFHSLGKMVKALGEKKGYEDAPMTPSFWNTEVHTLGFEKLVNSNSIKKRHHIRLWDTGYVLKNGKVIYVGSASFDVGLKWGLSFMELGLTHKISPDVDTERELVFGDLSKTGLIRSAKEEQFVPPTLGQNFTGDQFFTDGKIYIITVKQ